MEKLISVTFDTTAEIVNGCIDPNGDNGEEHLIKELNKNHVSYEVENESGPGAGWPEITYTGTKENLIQILVFFDAYSRDVEALTKALTNWDGDEDDLTNIIC